MAVLTQIVNASANGVGQVQVLAPGPGELGSDQPCDILYIRNRTVDNVMGNGLELVSLLGMHELRQYDDIHCVFCRSKTAGAPTAAAPNRNPASSGARCRVCALGPAIA